MVWGEALWPAIQRLVCQWDGFGRIQYDVFSGRYRMG